MNRKISTLLCTTLLAMASSSCIYEDEVPCACDVRFVYDYNMEFADAFPLQVNDVRLFVFDTEGRFVTALEDRGDRLGNGYRMQLDLQPGTYQLIAWAGQNQSETPLDECYRMAPDGLTRTADVATREDIRMSLDCRGASHDQPLADLWHGMVSEFTVTGEGPAQATLGLVKNVNRFRILLQSHDGTPLQADDYTISLRAANHQMEYDNSLLPCQAIDYQPYVKQTAYIANDTQTRNGDDGNTSDDTGNTNSGNGISALVAELATLRLVDGQETRFIVRNERTGQDLFNIDLLRYLDLMRLDQYSSMSLQEYLDRENTWQVILLLGNTPTNPDPDTPNTVLSLQINAWRMVFNQTEL